MSGLMTTPVEQEATFRSIWPPSRPPFLQQHSWQTGSPPRHAQQPTASSSSSLILSSTGWLAGVDSDEEGRWRGNRGTAQGLGSGVFSSIGDGGDAAAGLGPLGLVPPAAPRQQGQSPPAWPGGAAAGTGSPLAQGAPFGCYGPGAGALADAPLALSLSPFDDCLLGLEEDLGQAFSGDLLPSGLSAADATSTLLPGTPTFAGGVGLPSPFHPGLDAFQLLSAAPPALAAMATPPLVGAVAASSTGASSGGLTPPAPAPAPATEEPPRRKRGRPRLYDTAPPAAAGAAPPAAAAPGAAPGAPLPPPSKRRRGPKPKYVFPSQQEALGARRERNRQAALESYYRKKARTAELEGAAARLAGENAALERLLAEVEATGKCPLLEPTEAALDLWLAAEVPPPAQ